MKASLAKRGWEFDAASGPQIWYASIGGKEVREENYLVRWKRNAEPDVVATATLQVGVPAGGSGNSNLGSLRWYLGGLARARGGPIMHCNQG